jgi:primosomal protein N' (replication factor Y) (superfamily II helicase)
VNYYRVWINSPKFHGNEPLTYSHDGALSVGSIVSVELKNTLVSGLIAGKDSKPSFEVKPISRTITSEPLPKESVKLYRWLKEFYPAPSGTIMSLFMPNFVVVNPRGADSKVEKVTKKSDAPEPKLTKEQELALQEINKKKQGIFLLHGNTGTGKTRVYTDAAKKVLKEGKSTIILTPEIGLTAQLAEDIKKALDYPIKILHSHLTPAQKRLEWENILTRQSPQIIIGPRSALFAPVKNLGLIVVDEFHDSSYKQEQLPFYQTNYVAAKLAQLHSCKIIFGSATPSISDYHALKSKSANILRLKKLAASTDQDANIDYQIVDLGYKDSFSKSGWLSNQLIKGVDEALSSGQQSLILLNRRGSARIVMCAQCEWQALCPNCDLPLTFHKDQHKIFCHTCGFSSKPPTNCENCQTPEILYKSAGTKTIALELEKHFPDARIKRFDKDNLKIDRLEKHYESIKKGDVDIIIGTQIIAKGLDLPKLGLVGITSADTSLMFPDYTAEEKTYQLINQAIGRAGRGHGKSKIVVQTRQPKNQTIIQALNSDYEGFFEEQIKQRRQHKLPPFVFVLKLSCTRKHQATSVKTSEKLALHIEKAYEQVEVIGPSPAFHEKNLKGYKWQLIIKSSKRSQLLKIINELPSNWNWDIDPSNLL